MRKIVQKELAVRVPVVVYVSPNGARAASAGVWISEAADVLAMAPGTNIGSSTPITGSGQNIPSDLRRKVINDAAASLRVLARSHHRNAKWADLAVRKASNLSADEALRENVIDLVSPSLPSLLRTIDGRKIHLPQLERMFTLHTAGATIVDSRPGFVTRFLSSLIDPNIIGLLFLAGIAGIGYEIFHPGVVLPGALGAVCLLTALFGFSVGNLITFPALVIQREFDAASFGMLMALASATCQTIFAFGPGLLGLVRDLTGGYAAALALCIALELVAAAVALLGRPKPAA